MRFVRYICIDNVQILRHEQNGAGGILISMLLNEQKWLYCDSNWLLLVPEGPVKIKTGAEPLLRQ